MSELKNLFEPRPIDPGMIIKSILEYNPEEEKRKETYMKNCPHVEFEQDMGAHIPICKLYGCPCHVQCLRNVFEPSEGGTDNG